MKSLESVLLHNPSCSKSRAALELLGSLEVPFRVRTYLDDLLSREELKFLLKALGEDADFAIRQKKVSAVEPKSSAEDAADDALEYLLKHPSDLQRPILIMAGKAVIGRPVEKIEQFILSSMN